MTTTASSLVFPSASNILSSQFLYSTNNTTPSSSTSSSSSSNSCKYDTDSKTESLPLAFQVKNQFPNCSQLMEAFLSKQKPQSNGETTYPLNIFSHEQAFEIVSQVRRCIAKTSNVSFEGFSEKPSNFTYHRQTVDAMKRDIMNHGPIVSCLSKNTAVIIDGWTTDYSHHGLTPYWFIRNYWGTTNQSGASDQSYYFKSSMYQGLERRVLNLQPNSNSKEFHEVEDEEEMSRDEYTSEYDARIYQTLYK